MKTTIIHIGYHKTGTTWLQSHVLFKPELGFARLWTSNEVVQKIVLPNALDFDSVKCRVEAQARIDDALEKNQVPIFSCERLSGDPSSGGFDSKEMADRLHTTFPEARIIIGIREQKAMILSAYKQYVRAGGTCSLQHYLEVPTRGAERMPWFQLSHFAYHRLIGYYQSLFGAEQVLVLPFEFFVREPQEFVTRLVDFCGSIGTAEQIAALPFKQRANEGLSATLIGTKRWANFLDERDGVNPGPLFPGLAQRWQLWRVLEKWDLHRSAVRKSKAEVALKEIVARTTSGYYKESNRQTADLTGFDLAAYGYEI